MKLDRRNTARPAAAYNEIYLTRKKPLSVYKNRVNALMDEGISEIVIHASGQAIANAIQLGLGCKSHFTVMEVKTSTIQVIDDLVDTENEMSRIRNLSAIHIRLK